MEDVSAKRLITGLHIGQSEAGQAIGNIRQDAVSQPVQARWILAGIGQETRAVDNVRRAADQRLNDVDDITRLDRIPDPRPG